MNDKKIDFNDVFNTFQPKILRYLTILVGKNEAEDLTQEVFVKVSKGLISFRGNSSLSTWIYRIATNTAMDKMRSPSFQQSKQNKSLDDSTKLIDVDTKDKAIMMQGKIPSVDQQLIKKNMDECIREFVDNLSENYRTVIILSELEGLKNQEIAYVLDISLDTVKIRLHRARAKLKGELRTGCDFYRDEDNELACDRKNSHKESINK